MRALFIRQPLRQTQGGPYAELIPSTYSGQALRGIKTVEYRFDCAHRRPQPAWDLKAVVCVGEYRIIGKRFYIYAARGETNWGKVVADNIVVPFKTPDPLLIRCSGW
jgi:hypothetical protein